MRSRKGAGSAVCAGLVLLALVGCSRLSSEDCKTGDWYAIGAADGAAGRAPDYIDTHRRACSTAGITPDLTAWQSGRSAGLTRYCAPENVYQVARKGQTLAPYCSASQLAASASAQQQGARYYELWLEIGSIEREMSRVRRDARGTLLGGNQAVLSMRMDNLRLERDQLRREQARYASYIPIN